MIYLIKIDHSSLDISRSVIERVCNFLNKKLTETEVENLLDHLDISNFRKNPSVNVLQTVGSSNVEGTFVRKGKVGGWKEEFEKYSWSEKSSLAEPHFTLSVGYTGLQKETSVSDE